MQSDVQDLKGHVERLTKNDATAHGSLLKVRDQSAALSERIAVI